jgi:hypothetical protein
MTAIDGRYDAVIKVMSGSNMVASGPIRVIVSADPVPDDAIESDSDIQGLIAEARAAFEPLQQEVDVLSAGMDEFASLPPGSTEGNAELVDIRAGADGTTYPTAGDAVRNQVTDLKTALETSNDVTGIVNYPGVNAESLTTRQLTWGRRGMRVSINGQSDASIHLKISGTAVGTIAAATWQGWDKDVTLKKGKQYTLRCTPASGAINGSCVVRLYNSNNDVIAETRPGEPDGVMEVGDADTVCNVQIVIGSTATFVDAILDIVLFDSIVEKNADNISDLTDIIKNRKLSKTVSLQTGKRYILSANPLGGTPTLATGTGLYYPGLDISFAKGGGSIKMSIENFTGNATVSTLITDDNDIIVWRSVSQNIFALNDASGKYEGVIAVTSGTKLYLSIYGGSDTFDITVEQADASYPLKTRYVAADGDDANDGLSATSPMATINHALESGGETILLAAGKYFTDIDMARALSNTIKIAAANRDGLPVLYSPDSLIASAETAVAGYTRVFSAPCNRSFDDKNIWIFQDSVEDTSTAIPDDERHPLQRGKTNRCDDTKITICSASTLADALAEIEAASVYKWYHDAENSIIYFSRPQDVTADTPIMGGFGHLLLQNANRTKDFSMIGVSVKYQAINLVNLISPELTDCACGNVRGAAAFQWDGTAGAKLTRCEAYRVFYTRSTGDGFNAHSKNTGDAFAKQTTSTLVDCWSHDNCDDGYSDHERCEISIFGGLFEYNGAGVTPAVGSHCTVYNTLSRYNDGEADFYYTGNPTASEGGVGGQIACYGCVSIGKGSGRGFRLNGSNVQGLFVNCVCKDRANGFFSEQGGDTQVGILINCSTINCATPKSARFISYNGEAVN